MIIQLIKNNIKYILFLFIFIFGLFIGYIYEHNKYLNLEKKYLEEKNSLLNKVNKINEEYELKNKQQQDKDKALVDDLNNQIEELKNKSFNNEQNLKYLLEKNKIDNNKNCKLDKDSLSAINKILKNN